MSFKTSEMRIYFQIWYKKMSIVMQTDMDPALPRFRLGDLTHVGFRTSTRFVRLGVSVTQRSLLFLG